MPRNPLDNVRAKGVLRRALETTTAGPADELLTPVTITPTGVVHRKNNNGTIVHQVLGDGRQVTPVQSSEPSGLAAGQFFPQEISGVTYWAYVDSGGNKRLLAPTEIVESTTLTDSVAVAIDTVPHAGAIEWLVNINDGADGNLAFRVLAASTSLTTVDYTVQPGTGAIPHTVEVTRTGGITSLEITASGAGYSASARRVTLS